MGAVMTDEIRELIAGKIADASMDRLASRDAAHLVLTALHAAGYEIVPAWSANLDSAPRYTSILIWDHDEAFVGYKNDHELFGTQTEVLPEATHWKPITAPKEPE